MTHKNPLETEAQAIADATAQPPFFYQMTPEDARKVLEDVQADPEGLPKVHETWHSVPAEVGDVQVRLVKPATPEHDGLFPVVVYLHGGGWVLGSAATHDRLVRDLATGADVAVAFVEYDRSPEAQYPVAVEQGYAVAQWITRSGFDHTLDSSRIAVAGDSVGGNMAAALALLAKERGDVVFQHQSLYYPVTDAARDTQSYHLFGDGPFLLEKSMEWFWDSYLPDHSKRELSTVSPLRASLEDLQGLPETFVVVAENDVLRDEGEAYARRLLQAGVRTTSVRYNATIHDFMMLNPLRPSAASTAAVEQAVHVLRKALHA